MKVFVYGIMLMLLGGCGDYIGPAEYQKAEELCADNGGVRFVYDPVTAGLEVRCNNGALFKIPEVKQ